MSTAKPRPQAITQKPKVASLHEYVFSEYLSTILFHNYLFYYWRMGVRPVCLASLLENKVIILQNILLCDI